MTLKTLELDEVSRKRLEWVVRRGENWRERERAQTLLLLARGMSRRGYDRVDRPAHGESEVSQHSEVLRGLQCNVGTAEVYDLESLKRFSSQIEVSFHTEALQYLGKNQVSDHDPFLREKGVEPVYLRGIVATEEVYPYTGVDEDHLSFLIASRSPSH